MVDSFLKTIRFHLVFIIIHLSGITKQEKRRVQAKHVRVCVCVCGPPHALVFILYTGVRPWVLYLHDESQVSHIQLLCLDQLRQHVPAQKKNSRTCIHNTLISMHLTPIPTAGTNSIH